MLLPVAQQGEDHTPHAFHENSQTLLCKQRNGHKRATSCLTPLLCSACARLTQHHPPHFDFPVPQQSLCLGN